MAKDIDGAIMRNFANLLEEAYVQLGECIEVIQEKGEEDKEWFADLKNLRKRIGIGIALGQETPSDNFDAFTQEFGDEETFLAEYRGRNFYVGPAVVTSEELALSDIYARTPCKCMQDNMGLEYIVYPVK
jgi:hypothetical protein